MRTTLSALLLLAAHAWAAAADLTVMPVSVQLDRQRDRSTVQITNQGQEAATIQVDAGQRRRATDSGSSMATPAASEATIPDVAIQPYQYMAGPSFARCTPMPNSPMAG